VWSVTPRKLQRPDVAPSQTLAMSQWACSFATLKSGDTAGRGCAPAIVVPTRAMPTPNSVPVPLLRLPCFVPGLFDQSPSVCEVGSVVSLASLIGTRGMRCPPPSIMTVCPHGSPEGMTWRPGPRYRLAISTLDCPCRFSSPDCPLSHANSACCAKNAPMIPGPNFC